MQRSVKVRRNAIKNDLFFLGIAIALRDGKIDVEQARAILSDALPTLDFTTLEDVRFVGDGSYLKFHDKCVEVRKSGTDAKTKAMPLVEIRRSVGGSPKPSVRQAVN